MTRALLDRIEDPLTGRMCDFLYPHIPADKYAETERYVSHNPSLSYLNKLSEGVEDMHRGDKNSVINTNCWMPSLEIIGADGFDSVETAGNVFRHKTELLLSIRLPPKVNYQEAFDRLKQVLETNPPYNAQVSFEFKSGGNGWSALPFDQSLIQIFNEFHKQEFS